MLDPSKTIHRDLFLCPRATETLPESGLAKDSARNPHAEESSHIHRFGRQSEDLEQTSIIPDPEVKHPIWGGLETGTRR